MAAPFSSDLDRALALVLRYGWNATAYQILNPGIRHWFWLEGDAVVGYVRTWRMWVAAGAPVCAPDQLGAASTAFEATAAAHGARVCYFGADARLRAEQPGYSEMLLGAQPVWDPAGWPAIIENKSSLRAQRNRARNKGAHVSEWSGEHAAASAALRRCLDEWLQTRGLPAMHFLVEPETLGRLMDRRVFVAEREGDAVAFLVASPIPARNGWLVEQLVRGVDAPNGTATLLIDAAMRALAADGATYVTLGLSPLSRRATTSTDNPLWLRLLLGWVRAHGRRFYNFEGLERFKTKFCPDRWDPITALSNERAPTPLTLRAIADAFSGEGVSPVLFVGGALVDALQHEVRTLWGLRG
jgi:phosphatidylglycerol lysyltransferase